MTEHGEGAPERERLVSTQCRACGGDIDYGGTGRRPRYCSAACRQRGWALRHAEHAIYDDIGRDTTQPQRLAYALASALAALDAACPGSIDWQPLPATVGQPTVSHPPRSVPEEMHSAPPLSRQQRRAREREQRRK